MNRTLLAIVASLAGICAVRAADGDRPNPLAKATQEEANSFYGLSQQDLVATIGYPFEVKTQTGVNGAGLIYYTYIPEWKYPTWFVISADKGTVITGEFKGTKVMDPNWKPPIPEPGGQGVSGGRNGR